MIEIFKWPLTWLLSKWLKINCLYSCGRTTDPLIFQFNIVFQDDDFLYFAMAAVQVALGAFLIAFYFASLFWVVAFNNKIRLHPHHVRFAVSRYVWQKDHRFHYLFHDSTYLSQLLLMEKLIYLLVVCERNFVFKFPSYPWVNECLSNTIAFGRVRQS